jgi:hypothetical protein
MVSVAAPLSFRFLRRAYSCFLRSSGDPALINGLEASIQSLIGKLAEGGWGMHSQAGAGGVRATRRHHNAKGEPTVSARPPGTQFTLAATFLRLPLHGARFKEVCACPTTQQAVHAPTTHAASTCHRRGMPHSMLLMGCTQLMG